MLVGACATPGSDGSRATTSTASDDGAATTVTTETTTTTADETSTTAPVSQRWTNDELDAVGRLVTDGTVVLTIDFTDDALDLVALDITDGSELWRTPWSPAGRFGGSGLGGFAIIGDVVAHAVGPIDDPEASMLVGRDLRSGDLLWEIDAPLTFGAEPCGAVFCGSRASLSPLNLEIVGLDPATGDERWTAPGLDVDYVTDDDLAISLWPGENPLITGIDPAVGEIWRVAPDRDFDVDMTSNLGWNFARVDDVIVGVLNRPLEDSGVTAAAFGLDAATGELRWLVEDARLTRWPNDRQPMLSPYVLDAEGTWWEHTELAVLDPEVGLGGASVSLPLSEPADDDADLTDGYTSFGVVFAHHARFDEAGNVFWFAGGEWDGIDPATAERVELDTDVLWYTDPPIVDLAPVGGSPTLAGDRWLAIDVATIEDIDTTTVDVPTFVGEHAGGWTVYVSEDGAVHGVAEWSP